MYIYIYLAHTLFATARSLALFRARALSLTLSLPLFHSLFSHSLLRSLSHFLTLFFLSLSLFICICVYIYIYVYIYMYIYIYYTLAIIPEHAQDFLAGNQLLRSLLIMVPV